MKTQKVSFEIILRTKSEGIFEQSDQNPSRNFHRPKTCISGQTRVAGIQSKTKGKLQIVASGLQQPWGLDFFPDGRMIVSEKSGSIRLFTKSGVVGQPIANVPAVRLRGDGGIVDLKASVSNPHFNGSLAYGFN